VRRKSPRTEEISGRVAEINSETLERERKTASVAAERAAITRQNLIDMAQEARKGAMEAGRDGERAVAIHLAIDNWPWRTGSPTQCDGAARRNYSSRSARGDDDTVSSNRKG
jgi:hypothetical protein